MEEKKFSAYAAGPNHKDWEALIKREGDLYTRSDDIRSPFARDYTRVLHSMAYRRMKHKTQVFFNGAGNDHICTRIEHVAHVESVSHTIAKTLGLNEELTSAIALAHDIGHAPFGHQGEAVLSKITQKWFGERFWHEKNGVYFVDSVELLEDNSNCLKNMELTFAVRNGIISHCGEMDKNCLKPSEKLMDPYAYERPGHYEAATWEGCIVKLADKIAYLGRDIQDALMIGGLIDDKGLKLLQDMASTYDQKAINTTVIMHNMILSICKESTPEEGLKLSDEMSEQMNAIKKFNYENIYNNKRMQAFKRYSELVLTELFDYLMSFYKGVYTLYKIDENNYDGHFFVKDFADWIIRYVDDNAVPNALQLKNDKCRNKKIYGRLEDEKVFARAVVDYIAGMTDPYAIKCYEDLLL